MIGGALDTETFLVFVQTAALIFYGGMSYQMLHDHERRITKIEEKEEQRT